MVLNLSEVLNLLVRRLVPIILTVASITLVLMASGCQSATDPAAPVTPPSPQATVNQLVDQGQFVEAIVLLEDLVKQQPDALSQRLILSSTYLASAGINSKDFFQISRAYSTYQPASIDSLMSSYSEILKQILATSDNRDASYQLIRNYLALAQSIEVFLRIFEALPSISAPQLLPVHKALQVVSVPLPPNQRGTHLYRAVLGLILFKHHWEYGDYISWSNMCTAQGTWKNTGVMQLAEDFSAISSDIGIAYPSKQSEMLDLEHYLKDLATSLNGSNTISNPQPKTRQMLRALIVSLRPKENPQLKGVEQCLGSL